MNASIPTVACAAFLLHAGVSGAVVEYQRLEGVVGLEHLATSVAASGDVAIAGAPDGPPALERGAAYVYRRSGASYGFEQTLEASDGAYFDNFGVDVDVDGDVAAVGRPTAGLYVFRWDGTSWSEEQKLAVNGYDLAVSGDVIATQTTVSNVTMFRRTGSTWSQEQVVELPPSGSHEITVALSGDVLAIGRKLFGGSNSVFLYRWNGSSWEFEQEVAAVDDDPAASFGAAVDVEGDRLVVGAPNDDVPAGSYGAGAVYVFDRVGGTWTQQQKLVSLSGEQLGIAVSLSGDSIVAGAPSLAVSPKARLYRKSGGSFVLLSALTPSSNPCSMFAQSVALANDVAVVAAPNWNVGVDECAFGAFGAAYVYDASVCGNSAEGPSEQCDDGNTSAGDGCSATCQLEPCNDAVDNDGDGFVDFPADPGCRDVGWIESPACQNGLNDDGQNGIDFDGGASLNDGVPITNDDPQCTTAYRKNEAPSGCGLGAELTVALTLLAGRRRGGATTASSD